MSRRKKTDAQVRQAQLLAWYDRHQRVLPWRAIKGRRPDPYHVWLSEIMLQQTTVVAVNPYFRKFLAIFPTVQDLADAPQDAVMAAWAGLGYYARARNLHKCAQVIAYERGGRFPETLDGLLELPGIGPYTAAAILSIAFDKPAVAVDGNVERVTSRFFAIEVPLPLSKPLIRDAAAELADGVERPGDFTQAFMELGATICTPKSPKCPLCPWQDTCQARILGIQDSLPRKVPKKEKPQRSGKVFWITNGKHGREMKVAIQKRTKKGLYENMYLFPTTNWISNEADKKTLLFKKAKFSGESLRHVFTHFDLNLDIWHLTADERDICNPAIKWVGIKDLGNHALPSLMVKVAKRMLSDKKKEKR